MVVLGPGKRKVSRGWKRKAVELHAVLTQKPANSDLFHVRPQRRSLVQSTPLAGRASPYVVECSCCLILLGLAGAPRTAGNVITTADFFM